MSNASKTRTTAAQRCWRIADVGLIIAGPIAALWFGGRHDLGRFVYILGVAVATFGWLAARCLEGPRQRPTRAYAVLVGAIAVVLLQVLQLPEPLLAMLSPTVAEKLPLWFEGGPLSLGAWRNVSIAPSETRLALALLAAHAILFVVLVQRLGELAEMKKLLRMVAYCSAGMAVIGLVQWLLPNGRMLWVYDHPHRNFGMHVQGAFANRNHFAHYVLLGLPAMAVWTTRSFQTLSQQKNKQRLTAIDHAAWQRATAYAWLWLAMLVVSVVAVLFSHSRGALVTLIVTAVVTWLMMARYGILRFRYGPLPIAATLVAVGATLLAGQTLVTETMQLTNAAQKGEFAAEAGRQAIWEANHQAFLASPWIGWGAGAHRLYYPLFFDAPAGNIFTHAESGWLQIASETGLAGLAVLFAAVLLVGSWAWRMVGRLDDESSDLAIATLPALLASLLHSTVDFVWYIPACLAMTLALAAVALRLSQHRHALPASQLIGTYRRWALPLTAATGVAAAALTYVGPASAAHEWDSYLRLSSAMKKYTQHDILTTPGDEDRHQQVLCHYLTQMLDRLEKVVAAHPHHVEARRQLCARNRQMFEMGPANATNQFSIAMVRDSALAARFSNPDKTRTWLHTAFGEQAATLVRAHRNARLAVETCPLLGQPYLALAELSFLSPAEQRDHATLLNQAITVRPADGRVLFEAGRLCQLEGRPDEGLQLWRACCNYPGSHWQSLSALMISGGVPASVFLEQIAPPRQVFLVASKLYDKLGSQEDVAALAEYGESLARHAEADCTDYELSRLWMAVSDLRRKQGRLEAACAALDEAEQLAPTVFPLRLRQAMLLIDRGEFAAAEPHIRWCLARRPYMTNLQRSLAEARRGATLARRQSAEDPQAVANPGSNELSPHASEGLRR